MQNNSLGKIYLAQTGQLISRIGLGGGMLGRVPFGDAVETVIQSYRVGINIVDVARIYGHAEKAVGNAIQQGVNIHVASKSLSSKYDDVLRDVEKSLKEIKSDNIFLYQMHGVNEIEDMDCRIKGGAWKALMRCKEEGIVSHLGITSHSPIVLIELLKLLPSIETIMIPHNIAHSHFNEKLFAKANSRNIGILAMKPFAGGALLAPLNNNKMPETFKRKSFLTVAECILPILSDKKIHISLCGFRSPLEVNKAVSDIYECDPKRVIKNARRKIEKFDLSCFCRNCKYCCPCKVHGWDFDFPPLLRLHFYTQFPELKPYIKNEIRKRDILPNKCIQCGECEPRCPYKLPIRRMLRELDCYLEMET